MFWVGHKSSASLISLFWADVRAFYSPMSRKAYVKVQIWPSGAKHNEGIVTCKFW